MMLSFSLLALMSPRKRTNQSRDTPPSPTTTTTTHVPADQPHHLRHTGPSISTRPRAGTAPSKHPSVPVQPELTRESPPTQRGAHEKEQPTEVRPRGARSSLTKFTSILLFVVLLLLAWYVYGMVTLLGRIKDQVGWWDIVVSDAGMEAWRGWRFGAERSEGKVEGARRANLEGSLNALADALGISPVQVASAVKPLIPKTSLTNIVASQAEQKGSLEAIRVLFGDTTRNDEGSRGVQDEEDVAEVSGVV